MIDKLNYANDKLLTSEIIEALCTGEDQYFRMDGAGWVRTGIIVEEVLSLEPFHLQREYDVLETVRQRSNALFRSDSINDLRI